MTRDTYDARAFDPVGMLNRWASLRFVSVGLARACGWAMEGGRVRRQPWRPERRPVFIPYAVSEDGARALVGMAVVPWPSGPYVVSGVPDGE